MATLVVGPAVLARMTPEILLIGIGLAILLPVVPFALEMLALRRLTTAAFGTLMSLEPAFAMIVGLIVLARCPAPAAWSASASWWPPGSAPPAAAPAPRRCPPKSDATLEQWTHDFAGSSHSTVRANRQRVVRRPDRRSRRWGRWCGAGMINIRYVGRRSGKTFETPVGYRRSGDSVIIGVMSPDKKTWWRNFLGDGAPDHAARSSTAPTAPDTPSPTATSRAACR